MADTLDTVTPTSLKAPPTADAAAMAWMRRVPMITGSLAALAGFLTVRGANLSQYAVYHSTAAVMNQEESSDKYAEYQADSLKSHIDQTASKSLSLSPQDAAGLQAEAKQFKDRQPAIKAAADQYAANRDNELTGGKALMREKDLTDYAGVAAQLGIALVSVAALTKKSSVFSIGVFCGAAAIIVTAVSFLAHVGIWDRLLHTLHLI